MTTRYVSRWCQRSPKGQNPPPWRTGVRHEKRSRSPQQWCLGEILLVKSSQNHYKGTNKIQTHKINSCCFWALTMCPALSFLILPTTLQRSAISPVTYTCKETLRGWIVYSDDSSSRWWGRNPHLGLSDPKAHAGPSTMLPQQPLTNLRCFFQRIYFCLPISKWEKTTNILRPNLLELGLFLLHAGLIQTIYLIKICLPNGSSLKKYGDPTSSLSIYSGCQKNSHKALEVTVGPGSSQYLARYLLGFRKGTVTWKCSVNSLCFKLIFDPR